MTSSDIIPSNGWMQTYQGRKVNPLTCTAEDISINDIAHSLSLLCRYGGHCTDFYSVAEHSLLMSWHFDDEPALARSALLHDATEAYMGDMIRPLKQMMPEYQKAEERLGEVIAERFDVLWPLPLQVMVADTRICLDEKKVLMADELDWTIDATHIPLGVQPRGMVPHEAERWFLQRFNQLFLGVKA